MIDLSQWRASIGSWNFCQRPPRFNHSHSIRSANGCRYHLFSTTGEETEIKLPKTAAFLIVFELVFLVLFLRFSIHILLHYSPVRLTGIVGGYFSFQYTVISAENWLQSEPICFHDNLLLLLLSGDVELNPGPLDVLNVDDLVDIIDALEEGGFASTDWRKLGLRLSINHVDLKTIETNYPKDVVRCLEECLVKWLRTGKATYAGLAEALKKMGEGAAAYHIIKYKLQHVTKQGTQYQLQVSPAPKSLDITDLNEILTLLKDSLFSGSWEDLGLQLGLYKPTLSRIQAKYPRDNDACLRECIAMWLKRADGVDSKGGANYVTLIEALEGMEQRSLADHICEYKLQHVTKQGTQYQLQVSPGTIDKWLKEGSVELTVTRVTMCGLPGTGKTCAQNLLLNKEALSDDSTQIADRTVRATRVSYDNNNWDEVTRKEMLGRLKADLLQKTPKLQVSVTTSQQNAPTSTSEHTSEYLQQLKVSEYTNSESDDDATDGNDINDDKTVITELLQTDSVKGFQKKEDWLYIIDSGGQPAYQELLPLFTRAASLNIITIDLSKPLDEELELEYRIDGKSYPCHSKSTQLACFESAVSSGAIFEPLIIPGVTDTDPEAKQSRSMHMILGTHYNDDNKEVGEHERLSCEETLSKFVSSLESYLHEHIIKTPADSVVFHVNSLAESSKREKYRKEVCQAIWGYGADASCKFKLPIRWFAFELSLPESRVITEKEAISIGEKYKMKEEDTKCALRYLHHVSLILYYPEVLDVVFTSPQPILKILSQLLALTYVNVDSNLLLTGRLSLSNKEYLLKGFFRENLLKNLKASSEVFSNHFQPSHLIKILHHLNIITPVQGNKKGDYFIPYALPSYTAKGLCIPVENPSDAKPLHLLYWNKQKDQFLPIPHGVFPLTIVNLLNQKQFNVIIPSEGLYLCRDAMSLLIEMNETYHTLHIVNMYSHVEVYYTGPRNNCAKVRELIIEAIKDSSKAINIAREYIHSAFSCQYRTNCIVTDKGKPKKPCAQTCTFDDDEYCCWFKSAISSGDSQSSTLGSKEASQVHKGSKAKRQASVRDMDETVTEETDYHSKRKHLVNDEHTDDISAPSLDITYLEKILTLLKNGRFNASWRNLGLKLGLYDPILNTIQEDNQRNYDRLKECIARWLERADGVDSKGGANYDTLAKALEEMDQKNTADYIRKNM